ncbi:hypothetical protein V5O48_015883 [Marasmius crinis-equi]|uniref:Uncharacterized protein n=1 Tax=Marasmius crinis-equi TaxID=585013 RepID=A0ABR3ETC3_9AGAR
MSTESNSPEDLVNMLSDSAVDHSRRSPAGPIQPGRDPEKTTDSPELNPPSPLPTSSPVAPRRAAEDATDPIDQNRRSASPVANTNPPQGDSEKPKDPTDQGDEENDEDDDEEPMEEDDDSPTFSREAVVFLNTHLPDFLGLASKKARRAFWPVLLPAFMSQFPDQLELERNVKVKPVKAKSDKQLMAMSQKARRAFKARLKRSRFSPEQRLIFRVKNWFWWRLGRKKGDKKPFQPLFDEMKKGKNPPRRRQLAHLVLDEFTEEVMALSEETSHLDQLNCRMDAARKLLQTMEPQVVAALEKKREDEFQVKMRKYKGQQATLEEDEGEEGEQQDVEEGEGEQSSKAEASPAAGWSKMTVEQRAEMLRCREGFIPVVQPFLDGLRDLTGYSMVLLAGVCTDPKEKRFTQATPDNMPDFAEHSGDKFKDFGKLFWRWLRDIKVATDAEPETAVSSDKPDELAAQPETENADQITQDEPQQPTSTSISEGPVNKTKNKRTKKNRGGELPEGQKKRRGTKKGAKGKKKAEDEWDSDKMEQSSDEEVEGLENKPASDKAIRPRPQPIRRSNRIQATENPVSKLIEKPLPSLEDLPPPPSNLSPLHNPAVYSLALRYVYDEIGSMDAFETSLKELLGDQFTWSGLGPLFNAVMAGEGTESCAAAVKALETEKLCLNDVEPLYHPEVYRLTRTFLNSTMLPDELDELFKGILGERYTSQETVAPLLDRVIELDKAGEDASKGILEVEVGYMDRLHRLVARKVLLASGLAVSEEGGNTGSVPELTQGVPTDVNSMEEDVVMEDPPPPTPPASPSTTSAAAFWTSPPPAIGIRGMRPESRVDDLEDGATTWNWKKTDETGSLVGDEPRPPSPKSNHDSPPSDRSPPRREEEKTVALKPSGFTTNAPIPEAPLPASYSEYKAFVEVMSTINIDDLPEFARYTPAGVTDRFIKGHMVFLLEAGTEKPASWERVVFKWADVESIWASKEFEDEEASKDGRPESLARWFAYGRLRSGKTPAKVSTEGMEADWWSWWTNANPGWRVKIDDKVVPGGHGSWDQIRAPGPNGIVLFLVALRWWHDVIENAEELGRWELALKSVFETLCRLHEDAL